MVNCRQENKREEVQGMYDLIIKNVRLIDGTGAPWRKAELAVKDGFIAAVGKVQGEARTVVDGKDHYLTPGFIDIHSHSDDSVLDCPLNESRILQGVTTEIGGNCGASMAPVPEDPEKRRLLEEYSGPAAYDWRTMGEFLDKVEQARPSVNFGCLTGHGTLRINVMGFSDAKATEEQCAAIRELGEQTMRDGAFGISSGLIYPPGSFADTRELIETAKAVVPYGGIYTTHMRDEGLRLIPSVEEALETARQSGASLEISHHKCTRKAEWQVAVKTSVAMIRRARRQGMDVTCDQYPYNASATSLTSNFPGWAFEGGQEELLKRIRDPEIKEKMRAESDASHLGRWGDICVSYTACEEDGWMAGRSLTEIGERLGMTPFDALCYLILRADGQAGEVNYGMCEEDIEYIMSQPFVMTGSDGQAMSLDHGGKPHPRNYGAFVRVLAHYCRDRALFPLEEGIRKMTAMPAAKLNLPDRGILRPGMRADLVLLDLEKLKDEPTYAQPQQACSGIEKVWVNGVLTAEDGRHTGARAGMVLRKNINC